MSEVSLILKKIISAIGLSQADEANLHAEVDNLVPTVLNVALGGETSAQGVQTALVPLMENFASSITARLVQFVENRLAGVPANAALPPMATLTAPADPNLTSAAPSEAILAAQATQPAAGVVAPGVTVAETEAPVVFTEPAVETATVVEPDPSDAALRATLGLPPAPVVVAPVVAPVEAVPVQEDATLASATDADFRAAGFKFNPNTGAAL
jgi:hypothetical protein